MTPNKRDALLSLTLLALACLAALASCVAGCRAADPGGPCPIPFDVAGR